MTSTRRTDPRRGPRTVAWLLLSGASLAAQAASLFDLDVWMRSIDTRSVAVQRAIASGHYAQASEEARELERLYGLTEAWFAHAGGTDDAVRIAHDGRALAAAIPPALEAGDAERARRAAVDIAHACNDCHDTYKPFK